VPYEAERSAESLLDTVNRWCGDAGRRCYAKMLVLQREKLTRKGERAR
jgi:hypothetical protein